MKFVGQDKLLATLGKYTAESLPKTFMLIGEKGCGKHTVAKMLAERLGLELVAIGAEASSEEISDMSQRAIPTLYAIDLADFSEKQQNRFLKFIEEPSMYSHVVLLAESEIGVLPTILNRCAKMRFEQYTVEQLREINWMHDESDMLFAVCNTPGKLLDVNGKTLPDMYALCDTIAHKIDAATWANTLRISLKINYKEDYDKFDFRTFFDMLEYTASKTYREEKTALSYKVYHMANKAKAAMANKPLVKENFMLSFLTQLWKATRDDVTRA